MLLALEITTARWPAQDPTEIRLLIRQMSIANPLWGAPRIHGELLKPGIDVGQTTVAKYMERRRNPPSQGWRTFLHSHADGIASIDLFVAPTVSFRLLYGMLICDPVAIKSTGWESPLTLRLNGSHVSSRRHAAGRQRRNTTSVTATLSTVIFSFAAYERWAFVTGRQRRDHRGKTDMLNGWSVRSGGIAWTMSLCSASGIFATCLNRIGHIITRLEHTYR